MEAKNLEVLRETITRASGENDKHLKPNSAVRIGKKEELMDYLLDVCMNIVQERDLRNQVSRTSFPCIWCLPTDCGRYCNSS